jgi:Zn-dependent oligopeptidase
MYVTVFKTDPLDPVRGRKYRDSILRVGGSRDDMVSLKVGVHKFRLRLIQLLILNSLCDHFYLGIFGPYS